MAWRVDLSCLARKNLAQMDQPAARRILYFFNERVSCLDDPRSIGETLKGSRLDHLHHRGHIRVHSRNTDWQSARSLQEEVGYGGHRSDKEKH